MFRKVAAAAWLCLLVGTSLVHAQSLRGSRTSMRKQNSVAQNQDYTFLETSADVWDFVEKGLLVPLNGNSNYKVEDASYPYARPAVKLFVERLAQQYRPECGEKLVVTSLTRPLSRQPANASDLSVHPAGMAVDLRRSKKASCRRWLERTLASLEGKGVLEATRERTPPHYHIAIYPELLQQVRRRVDWNDRSESGAGHELGRDEDREAAECAELRFRCGREHGVG